MKMMKMPETETAMMKCICNSCKSYEECMSIGTMKNMKAFCSTGATMEVMKEKCMDMGLMEKCMDTKQKKMTMKDASDMTMDNCTDMDLKENCKDMDCNDMTMNKKDMEMDCMEMDDCVCKECPVAEEYQLNDMMYCKGPSM